MDMPLACRGSNSYSCCPGCLGPETYGYKEIAVRGNEGPSLLPALQGHRGKERALCSVGESACRQPLGKATEPLGSSLLASHSVTMP